MSQLTTATNTATTNTAAVNMAAWDLTAQTWGQAVAAPLPQGILGAILDAQELVSAEQYAEWEAIQADADAYDDLSEVTTADIIAAAPGTADYFALDPAAKIAFTKGIKIATVSADDEFEAADAMYVAFQDMLAGKLISLQMTKGDKYAVSILVNGMTVAGSSFACKGEEYLVAIKAAYRFESVGGDIANATWEGLKCRSGAVQMHLFINHVGG